MKWSLYPALILLAISGVSANVGAFHTSDPRLEKRVTLEVDHIKLDDVAKSLSEQSGVDIKAGTGKRDWRVSERRVTIHAKDIPLSVMLEEIGKLTGYHLSREGKEGEWSYIIWQDLKARQFEEEMLIASKEAYARRAMDVRQGALDAAEEALRMTPEEALKRRDKEPLAAFLGGTRSGRGFAQILSSLRNSFPTEYELMMRGKRVTIPVSSFPPGLEGALADIMAGKLPTWMDKDSKAQLTPYQLVIEAMKGPDSDLNAMLGLGGLAFLYARPGDQQTRDGVRAGLLPMSSLNSKIGNLFGRKLLAWEEGVDPDEARKINDEVETPEGLADLMARKSPTEENPPTDPELLREIEILEVMGAIQPGTQSPNLMEEQGKMMGEIARAAETAVLLESYASMIPVSGFMKKGKQPFYHILVAAEKAGCIWELGEGTLRIRPEDWAIHRSQEVSESFLDHYKALLEKNGRITLNDIAAIAVDLTDAQIAGGLGRDPDLGHILATVIADKGPRDVLRAYGLMNPHQKSLLTSEDGLPFAQLTDQQWGYLEQIITDDLGGVQIIDGSIRIAPQKDEPGVEVFQLKIHTPDEEPRLVRISVNVPTKVFIKQMQDQRKKDQEAMEKAAAEKAAKDK